MDLRELILKNRSYRKFDEEYELERETLIELVDLARFSPSAANLQPLKFILSHSSERNNLIFPTLAWAGYIEDWSEPQPGERPTGYIVIVGDREISDSFEYDCGIACQSILLGAVEQGLGGCIIGAGDKQELHDRLELDSRYEIQVALALGRPTEEVELEPDLEENVEYFRDENDVHHVPKRKLESLILKG